MQAVVSILKLNLNNLSDPLINWINNNQPTNDGKENHIPHLTWFVAEHCPFFPQQNPLGELAIRLHPFTTNVTGYGIFPGGDPIFNLLVVKTQKMMDLHKEIWETCSFYCQKIATHFSPEFWIPHITLLKCADLQNNLKTLSKEMLFKEFEFDILINNVAIIYQSENGSGILAKWDFGISK